MTVLAVTVSVRWNDDLSITSIGGCNVLSMDRIHARVGQHRMYVLYHHCTITGTITACMQVAAECRAAGSPDVEVGE